MIDAGLARLHSYALAQYYEPDPLAERLVAAQRRFNVRTSARYTRRRRDLSP